MAEAALGLDDLLGIEHGTLVRGDRWAGGEDAPDLLRALADDVAVAGVGGENESIDEAGVAAVRDLDVRNTRVEGQFVAALAVVLEAERHRVHLVLRFDELVALRALQFLAPSLPVEHSAGLEVKGVIETQRIGIAPRREVGVIAAE